MKYFVVITLLALACVLAFNQLADAVSVSDGGDVVIIETENYEVHWKKAAQMGYTTAIVGGSAIIEGDTEGRRLYHSANYSGWKDWGELASWEVVNESPGMATVKFVSNDGDRKEYTVMATYYDAAEFIRHEVTITNVGNQIVSSFSDGHEPQFEIRGPSDGLTGWDAPIPHNAFWNSAGFGALYTETGTQTAFPDWANGAGNGRMHLDFADLGVDLQPGDVSDPIVYWVAFGTGGEAEANALADIVTADVVTAVQAKDKLATTWGTLKARQ